MTTAEQIKLNRERMEMAALIGSWQEAIDLLFESLRLESIAELEAELEQHKRTPGIMGAIAAIETQDAIDRLQLEGQG